MGVSEKALGRAGAVLSHLRPNKKERPTKERSKS